MTKLRSGGFQKETLPDDRGVRIADTFVREQVGSYSSLLEWLRGQDKLAMF